MESCPFESAHFLMNTLRTFCSLGSYYAKAQLYADWKNLTIL
jgi:hypothetical protein